jgi:hypothetical protein
MTSAPVRLGAYAGVLALAFGAAYALGGLADPIAMDGAAPSTSAHEETRPEPAAAALPGLAVAEAGYTLTPQTTALPARADAEYRFTVTGPDGHTVTEYEEEHEKELHLIVVRRDLAAFQHVHPTRAGDGTWSVSLDLRSPGTYRVFADFAPAGLGRGLTLGTDLAVAGSYRPAALPVPAEAAEVDGYRVRLAGHPRAGEETELSFTVAGSGEAVTDLQPYLGGFGHLVSLRTGDLAYLHTHPAAVAHAGDRGGPKVRFATTFPTAGSYRLFLDFKVDGQVRTAGFTIEVGGQA